MTGPNVWRQDCRGVRPDVVSDRRHRASPLTGSTLRRTGDEPAVVLIHSYPDNHHLYDRTKQASEGPTTEPTNVESPLTQFCQLAFGA
jgi:hypothetical protein